MSKDFFVDNGGDLWNVQLHQTADVHSRAIHVDGKPFGKLLFHDWTFQVEPTIPRFNLQIMTQLTAAINRDQSIQHQYIEDQRKVMTENARRALSEAEVSHQAMTDQEAVQAYFKLHERAT